MPEREKLQRNVRYILINRVKLTNPTGKESHLSEQGVRDSDPRQHNKKREQPASGREIKETKP